MAKQKAPKGKAQAKAPAQTARPQAPAGAARPSAPAAAAEVKAAAPAAEKIPAAPEKAQPAAPAAEVKTAAPSAPKTAAQATAKPAAEAAASQAAPLSAKAAVPASEKSAAPGPFRPVDPPLCGEGKFLPLESLNAWLAELSASRAVFAPRREGAAVVYRPFVRECAVELAVRPTESAKHTVFPRGEELFRFERQGDPENPGNRNLTLQEPAEPGPAVIFGALSCDARGFFSFDPVYDGCGTQGLSKDTYYLKRRDATALIVRPCRAALSTCFCHWTGGGPASTQGADMLATDVEGGFLLQPVTEKGESLLSSTLLRPADAAKASAAEAARAAATKSMGEAPDLSAAPAALLALFDNLDFWKAESAGCISCGACTYLCPTCYCFNITDESNGISGVRLRSWDTCMSSLFTLEASGHNPRTNKAARLRNRVGHKFSYYPRIHGGRFSCSGCGRCIKSCPSSVDIRKIVLDAVKTGNK